MSRGELGESLERKAQMENERGRSLAAAGDSAGAVAAYRAAAAADDTWSVPWFNLALVYKYRRDWTRCTECSREALLRDPSDEGAWWNLGIAATARGDWRDARLAWERCGLDIPDGEGPLNLEYGLTPIRLNPDTRAEVVWCDRIDPARAIVRNVPLPESGHRYGDLLLHDGAPSGTRILNGIEVPVFDALERLEASDMRTYVLDLPGSTEDMRTTLEDLAFESGMAAEDWSRSVRFLCRKCSEGQPHELHDRDLAGVRGDVSVAVASAAEGSLEWLIEQWRQRSGYDGPVGVTAGEADP